MPAAPGARLYAFGVGLGYDLLAFVYFAWPLVLLLWLLPAGWPLRRRGRLAVGALCLLLLFVLLFVAVAEWTSGTVPCTLQFHRGGLPRLHHRGDRQHPPVLPGGLDLAAVAALALGTFTATGRWRRVVHDSVGFAARSVVVAVLVGGQPAGHPAGQRRDEGPQQQRLRQRTGGQRHLPVLRRSTAAPRWTTRATTAPCRSTKRGRRFARRWPRPMPPSSVPPRSSSPNKVRSGVLGKDLSCCSPVGATLTWSTGVPVAPTEPHSACTSSTL